jgi:hypothetical protein
VERLEDHLAGDVSEDEGWNLSLALGRKDTLLAITVESDEEAVRRGCSRLVEVERQHPFAAFAGGW